MISQYSDKNLVKLSSEDSITKAIGAMQQNGIKEILVLDGSKVCLVDPHRILRLRNAPKNTKLKSVMYPAPTIPSSSDLIDAIKIITENGIDAVPIKEKGSVTGIITEAKLMRELLLDKQFGNIVAEEIMTKDPFLITETDSAGKARDVFLDNNIEHLPVVDKKGKIVGMLYEKDLMKIVVSGDELGQMDKGNKKSAWSAPVRDLLNSNVVTIHYKDMIKIATQNSSFDSAIVVIGEEGTPVGIITPKDVLEQVNVPTKRTGVYVQVSGMQDEDGFSSKEANAEIERVVQKLGATVPIERVLVHVKRYSEGGKVKYSIRTKLVTDSEVYTSNSWEWNLMTAIGSAMKMLEKQILKNKGKKNDAKKHPNRSGMKRNR